ncbi:hypothetical protein MPSEU_000991300 [Mayamaea pseudoterrestris]|nr:hypothetical protein MPSEU_000991300 [Mayamaea pseudoterrestris]
MPRGKNYVNNNRGLAMQRHKKENGVKCLYGSGCTRPDCKFSHPPKGEGASTAEPKQKSNEPCMPYLAGLCTFTAHGCYKRHPPKDEVDVLIVKYRQVLCRFGESCKTNGCLLVHPGDEEFDELQRIKQQRIPVAPIVSKNSSAFPVLAANGHGNIQAAAPPLPKNSAWKPSPPTGHAMAQSARQLQQQQPRPSSMRPTPLPPSLSVSARPSSSTSTSQQLSIHAREFTPGGL